MLSSPYHSCLYFVKHLVHHVHFDRFVILVLLATVVTLSLVIVRPAERIKELHDSTRAAATRDLLAALVEYRAAHEGSLPNTIDGDATTYQLLGTETFGCEQRCPAALTLNACLDLASSFAQTGLARVPVDPTSGSDFMTGYAVNKLSDGRLSVVSCVSENGQKIEAGQ